MKQDYKTINKPNKGKEEQKKNLTILIDGSGSMSGIGISESIADGLEITCKNDSSNKNIVLFGDREPKLLSTGNGPMAPKVKKDINWGLHCGTEFSPAISLANQLVSNKDLKQELVIISDGDVNDPNKSIEKFKSFIDLNPDVTISAVIIGGSQHKSRMETMLNNVSKSKINIVNVSRSEDKKSIDPNVVDAVVEVVTGNKNPESKVNTPEQILKEIKSLSNELTVIDREEKSIKKQQGVVKSDLKKMSKFLDERTEELRAKREVATKKIAKLCNNI